MDTSLRILRVFLNRWLDRVETDTGRTLRKLVEFGYYFSGSAPQKRFFTEAKNIISDGGSKYYTLLQEIFSRVGKDRAVEFGIDFGYYGLAKNARFSGEHFFSREKTGHVAGVISSENIRSENEGLHGLFRGLAQNGTSVFFVLDDNSDISDAELSEIIDRNPHNAFFLFTSDEDTAMKFAQKNVMTVLDLNSGSYDSISEKLKKRSRLFGGFYRYSDEAVEKITEKDFLSGVFKRNCLFLFLARDEGCSKEAAEKINNFSYRQKRKPSQPVFVSDIIEDLKWLNEASSRKVTV